MTSPSSFVPGHARASSSTSSAPFFPSQLFNEPIPVFTPHLRPLSYRIPLTTSGKDPQADDHFVESVAGVGPVPPSLAPAVLTPGPAVVAAAAASSSSASFSWRVRWACYQLTRPSQTTPASLNVTTSAKLSRVPSISYSLTPSGSTPTLPQTEGVPASPALSLSATSTSGSKRVNKAIGKARSREDPLITMTGKSKRQRLHNNPSTDQASMAPHHPLSQIFANLRAQLSQNDKTTFTTGSVLHSARKAFLAKGDYTGDPADHPFPQRLAYIHIPAIYADLTGESVKQLWLFSLEPEQDVDTDMFGSLPGLECELNDIQNSSGAFTPQDLFPSLYNDNSMYTCPGSRPAKVAASCLQITSPSNVEAVQASELFLLAVKAHLLDETLEKCHPAKVGRGLLYDKGLVWPALQTTLACPDRSQANGLYLSYDIHYDHDGMVANAFLRPIPLQHCAAPCFTNDKARITVGDSITLCPLAIRARFVRWYGIMSPDQPSRSQADREMAEIDGLAKQFAALLELNFFSMHSESEQADKGAYLLCRLEEQDIVWPASQCLTSSLRVQESSRLGMSEHHILLPEGQRIFSPTPRDLLPRTKRMEQLAEQTSAYIEHHGRERERERRERAERSFHTSQPVPTSKPAEAQISMVAAGFSTESHLGSIGSPSVPVEAQISSVKDFSMPGRPPVSTANISPAANPKDSDNNCSFPEKAINRYALMNDTSGRPFLGVPTLASIALMLPPPSMLKSPVAVAMAAPKTQVILPEPNYQNSYPTPQSNTVDQPSSGVDYPSTSTSTSNGVPSSTNDVQMTRIQSLGDGLDDMFWNSFASKDIPFGSGAKNDTLSFLDSDLSMFENGITEDDFSFFDTPSLVATASMPPVTSSQAPVIYNSIDANPLAFISSSGSIDHFGHLMPSGDSPASIAPASSTSPIFQDLPVPSALSSRVLPSVPFISESSSAFVADFLASPQHSSDNGLESIASRPQSSSLVAVGVDYQSGLNSKALHELVESDKTHDCKYKVDLLIESDNSFSAKNSFQVVGFAPLPFSNPLNTSDRYYFDGHEKRNHSRVDPKDEAKDMLRLHRIDRAHTLRKLLESQQKRMSISTRHIERKWLPQKESAKLDVDESSSETDSVSDPESLERNSLFEVSPRAFSTTTTTVDTLGPALLELKPLLVQLSLNTEAKVAEKVLPDKYKLSKAEKEALATVFFQQYLENVDLRDRTQDASKTYFDTYSPPLSPPPLLSSYLPSTQFEKMQQTSIAVVHHAATMRMSTSALQFWDKLGLQPHSGSKDVHTFVLAASSLVTESVKEAIEPWLTKLAVAYHTSGLGSLSFSSNVDGATGPILLLDCPDNNLSNISDLQEKLPMAGIQITKQSVPEGHTVVLILIKDEECIRPSSVLIQLCLRLHLLRHGLIPHLVPLSLLARPNSASSPPSFQCIHRTLIARLAFILYDRMGTSIRRHTPRRLKSLPSATLASSQATRIFPAPAFKLFAHNKPQAAFTMQWPPPVLDILDRYRLFHIAYALSSNGRWLCLAAIDDKGEHHALRVRFVDGVDIKLVIKRIWNFAKEIVECVSAELRINIGKTGSMPVTEIHAWNELLQSCVPGLARPASVTITCTSDCLNVSSETSIASIQAGAAARTNTVDAVYSHARVTVQAAFPRHPIAVFEDDSLSNSNTQVTRKQICYALASSFVHYVPKSISASGQSVVNPVSTRYCLHILLSASHPYCTYPHSLSSHLHDLIQSFVDLQVLGQERWSLTDINDANIAILPWHLAAVLLLQRYSIESLF